MNGINGDRGRGNGSDEFGKLTNDTAPGTIPFGFAEGLSRQG